MQIPRFFLTPEDVSLETGVGAARNGGTLDLQPGSQFGITNNAVSNQIRNVLRLRVNDTIFVLNNARQLFECQITANDARKVVCKILERRELPPDAIRIVMALAITKGERFDLAIQKLTELGVWQIVPLLTQRCVVRLDTSDVKGVQQKVSRWQTIAREAAEQSERATIPHIVAPQKYSEWIAPTNSGATGGIGLICAERIQKPTLRDILLQHSAEWKNLLATTDKTITIVIGPEGGLVDEEVDTAQNQGFMPVSLGHRILRSETAAIFAMAQAIWCLEI